jgi:phenylacetate 2-hydroxylase
MCSPEGRPFQAEVYAAIIEAYNGDRKEAWRMAFQQENVPLVVSLYKETLRFFSTAAFNHRRASKEIRMNDTVIPKGMAITMNIQGVNHDPEHYGEDALIFNPRRFLTDNTPTPHMSYGVGGRICPAWMISNRIMGAVLTRLVLAFEMEQVQGMAIFLCALLSAPLGL